MLQEEESTPYPGNCKDQGSDVCPLLNHDLVVSTTDRLLLVLPSTVGPVLLLRNSRWEEKYPTDIRIQSMVDRSSGKRTL